MCDVRASITDQMNTLDYAQRLWELFRALICNALDEFRSAIGEMADEIALAIHLKVETFLTEILQLDVFTLATEFEA